MKIVPQDKIDVAWTNHPDVHRDGRGTRTPIGLITLSLSLSVLAGCGWKTDSAQLEARNPSTGELFTCETESQGAAVRARLQCPGDHPPIWVSGKPDMLAVNRDGSVAALVLRPMVDGKLADESAQRLFLIDVPKQKLIWQWDLQDQNGERRFLSFSQLALNSEANVIAAVGYARGEGRQEVAIWTNSGQMIRQLPMPAFQSVSGNGKLPQFRLFNAICLSPNDEKIAVATCAGTVPLTSANVIPPPIRAEGDGIIYSWIIASGSLTTCPTKGVAISRDLCYDAKGEHVIAWSPAGQGTNVTEIDVWELLTGRLKHQDFRKGRVVGITPSAKGDSWRVLMDDKSALLVPYP